MTGSAIPAGFKAVEGPIPKGLVPVDAGGSSASDASAIPPGFHRVQGPIPKGLVEVTSGAPSGQTPPLPKGFVLDHPSNDATSTPAASEPPLPKGFVLDTPAPAAKPGASATRPGAAEQFFAGLTAPVAGVEQLATHLGPAAGHLARGAFDYLAGSPEFSADAERAQKAQGKGLSAPYIAGDILSPLNYVPGADIAGREGFLARIGSSAAQGAAVAALQPTNEHSFWQSKAAQIIEGGATGGVLSPVLDLGAKVAAPIVRMITGQKGADALETEAAKRVIRRIARSAKAGGPTAQDMLDLLHLTPSKPLTLADLGPEDLKELLGHLSRQPGESREIVQKFMRERDLRAGLRLHGDINQGIAGASAFSTTKALEEARATAAAPLYDSAFSRIKVTPKEFDRVSMFVNDPIGKAALNEGMRVIQIEDLAQHKAFDPKEYGVSVMPDGSYVFEGDKPTLRLLDAVKRGYDEIVYNQTDEFGRPKFNQYRRAVELARASYVRDLREMFPRYASALDAWGGPSRSREMVQAGQDFLRKSPEEIAHNIKTLTPNDRQFFLIGAAHALRDLVDKAGPRMDEAKKIIGTQRIRDQLRPLFHDNAAYEKFVHSVEAEGRMFDTGAQALSGSATAKRLAEDEADTSEAVHAVKAGVDLVRSGFSPFATYHLASMAHRFLNRPEPGVDAATARLLTTPVGPKGSASRVLHDLLNGTGWAVPAVGGAAATPYAVPAVVAAGQGANR